MNEARAAETGLPVAKVVEVLKIRDHWCIRREHIEGETLAAAEPSREQTPKNRELLLHWASVVDIE